MASKRKPAQADTGATEPPAAFAAELRITDPRAAALLIDTRRNRWLRPFLARCCGISDAARELGVGKSGVSYWVRQFSQAGLVLACTDARGRTGWRSVADRLVVALADAPQDSDAAILGAQLDPAYAQIKHALLHAAQRHPSPWQFVLERLDGKVHQRLTPMRGTLRHARIVNQRAVLQLSDSDARALQDELMALHERYARLSQQQPGRRQLLTWLCAVDEPEAGRRPRVRG